MTEQEEYILKATKEFADIHGIPYDEKIESMILNAMKEVKNCVRQKVTAEIEREYGKFSEMEDGRKDNFYLMLGIIDNALKK